MDSDYIGFSIIAYCIAGFLLPAHIRLARQVKDLKSRLEAIEAAASTPGSD